MENQRDFFIQFAKKQKFDPLQASNWYSVSSAQVVAEKVCQMDLKQKLTFS